MALRDERGRIIIGGGIDPNWVASITVTYTEGNVSVSTGYDITVTEG